MKCSDQQVRGFAAERKRRSAAADARQADAIVVQLPGPTLPVLIDPQRLPPRARLGRPPGMRTLPLEHMPLCPRCSGDQVKRAGFARGRQVYHCHDCARKFMGRGFRLEGPKAEQVKFLCYRCGSTDVADLGLDPHSGRRGYCRPCRRRFIQGGRTELEKYHLLLERRVRELKLPKDVEAEVMQAAFRDVIEGRGYCWTVDIRKKEGWRAVRGEFGQRGSDHPEFRKQQGQKIVEE